MSKWSKENIENIVSTSTCASEVLKKLNICVGGDNWKTLEKYIKLYEINTSHFKKVSGGKKNKKSLDEILIQDSSYSRTELKKRLYKDGLLEKKCCMCGQGENWNGMKISLILDHINGVNNDNRLENLRIVCPNCNAGLDTFAGKNTKRVKDFNFCECGSIISKQSNRCNKCVGIKERRKVERPSLEELKKEVEEFGYSAVGRKYGVSDNAIRKWLKSYEYIS